MKKYTFKKKIAVITGASSGIGEQCAHQLAAKGSDVVLVARNLQKLETVHRSLPAGNHLIIPADVSRPQDVNHMIQKTQDHFGRIDILINNAGIGLNGSVVSTPWECFDKIIKVNLYGTLYCIRAAFPIMDEQGGGVIVNVSSVAGFKGFPDSGLYSATKFAVNGLTESLAWEAAQKNIHLLLVCPGKTQTHFEENLVYYQKQSDASRKGVTASFVAQKIVQGIQKQKDFIVVGEKCVPLYLLNRLSPRLTNFILKYIY